MPLKSHPHHHGGGEDCQCYRIPPLDTLEGLPAKVKRPHEIAHFSYDEDHVLYLDDRSLRYYYPPDIGVDLSAGFETFKSYNDSKDEHIDSLLQSIMALEKVTGERCEADFITWRGMISKFLAVPYERFDGFEMNATCFQGTIFIEENHEFKMRRNHDKNRRAVPANPYSQSLMGYWGYKFETLSLIPDTWDTVSRDFIESRPNMAVDNGPQYCSIVKTGIGNSSLVIGGEVDGVWDCKPDDRDRPINWVELKTAEIIRTSADVLKFERKLMKFWIQSFLLGVPKIVVGFRSKDGILQHLQEIETQEIPARVRSGTNAWSGKVCVNFAAHFLEFLKEKITGEGVWRIRWGYKEAFIEVTKMEEKGYGNILTGDFIHWREGLVAGE